MTKAPKSTISIEVPITLDNEAVDLSAYSVNDPFDGTKGSPAFKIQASVGTVAGTTLTPATTVDSILCDKVTMYRSPDSSVTNIAVLKLRKGFNPTENTTYTVIAWYDATSGGSDGWRECGRATFDIRLSLREAVEPPYNS